jgi:very-short-patch-repair endonuclease
MRPLAEVLDALLYAFGQMYRTKTESPIEAMLCFALYRDLGYRHGTGALSRARVAELRASIGDRVSGAAWVFTQYPIGRYRADLLVVAIPHIGPPACLVVECDGKDFHSSSDQVAYDDERDWEIREAGFPVIRFSGSAIYSRTNAVLARIVEQLGSVGADICRSTGRYPRPLPVDYDEVDYDEVDCDEFDYDEVDCDEVDCDEVDCEDLEFTP